MSEEAQAEGEEQEYYWDEATNTYYYWDEATQAYYPWVDPAAAGEEGGSGTPGVKSPSVKSPSGFRSPEGLRSPGGVRSPRVEEGIEASSPARGYEKSSGANGVEGGGGDQSATTVDAASAAAAAGLRGRNRGFTRRMSMAEFGGLEGCLQKINEERRQRTGTILVNDDELKAHIQRIKIREMLAEQGLADEELLKKSERAEEESLNTTPIFEPASAPNERVTGGTTGRRTGLPDTQCKDCLQRS